MASYPQISRPRALAETGERIYKEKYQSDCERDHFGRFVAVDVRSELIYVADTPEKALKAARESSPKGIFHLIKVGSIGAFSVSHTVQVDGSRHESGE